MTAFLSELKLAFRSLRKSPAFFAAATVSLALGIATNSTIFAALDAFLIRPLPYHQPDQLMQVWNTIPERGWNGVSISLLDFEDWRKESRLITLSGYTGRNYSLTGIEMPERLLGYQVTGLFGVLGVPALFGRTLGPADEEARDQVVVLSHRFWQRRFNGDSAVIGQTLLLDGRGFTVVGVMGPQFQYPNTTADFWTPLVATGAEERDDRNFGVLGRLNPGATEEGAQAELSGIADRLARAYPETNQGLGVRVLPLSEELYDATFRQAALICSVAVAFVLLIACANVANLLLARGAVRSQELGIRAALGAGRWRIIRQLLVESLLIALAGGALGVLLSFFGVKGLLSIMPPFFTRVEEIAVNGRLLVYILGISLLSGLIFGLAPAWQSSRADLFSSLRETGRSSTPGTSHGRLRKAFVVVEVALALVLLISAGLLIKASVLLQRVDLGFEPRGAISARLALPEDRYPDSTLVIPFLENLVGQLGTLPGVTAAAATTGLPMNSGTATDYAIEGRPPAEKGKEPIVQFRAITPGYLELMRIPVQSGRPIMPEDRLTSRQVALVNQAMVRLEWPDSDPLGQRIVLSSGTYEIVGVVADAREFGPDDETPATMFVAQYQRGFRGMNLVLRSNGDPGALAPAIRQTVQSLDAGLPVYQLQTLEEMVANEGRGDRVMTKLLAIFGGLALVLAVLGVYGVMAYTVAQRTREMGIRMALGAEAGDIVRLVLRQGSQMTLLGLAIGLLIAFGVTRTLAVFLYGVSTFDVTIFGGVTAALLSAALIAIVIPARRATRVDPLIALRD